jgi:hypothetical protein
MVALLGMSLVVLLSGACSRKEKTPEPAPASEPAPAEGAPAEELPATPVSPEGGSEGASGSGSSPAPDSAAAPAPAGKPAPAEESAKPTERPAEPPAEPAAEPPADESPADESSGSGKAGSLPAQGQPCDEQGRCGKGMTCIEFYGIAGPRGPKMTSCEIRCKGGKGCPPGQICVTIADGPGQVCRAD